MSKVTIHRGYRIQKDLYKYQLLDKQIDSGWDTYYYRFSTLRAAKACIDRFIESGEWEEVK
jgi:hypothetical protein